MTTLDQLNARSLGTLPGLIGIEFTALDEQRLTSRLVLRPELPAPNGYLHAATVVALADTSCGYGAITHLPPGAHSFTTVELKTNFLGTARSGVLECVATLVHGGRTTQVWDAVMRDTATGATLALFRCTQLLIYPRPPA
ncbi:MAG: PaaI family thioesterase [Chloroflexota bacterium]|nr:PaaI family thioesterase [Chloroflexota bacterium]